ncbi:uncharacterized protein LOC127465996 isoform X6 [Manacus candei]|uniref:uncharacterized protein LOC127465996 isoform X6 n=1 Tax=Manacus candei TaxID=415023 RepID=UPI0022267D9E|nr:uncharacterized protein LOC127465996 isoform X6 [Manacus candei]
MDDSLWTLPGRRRQGAAPGRRPRGGRGKGWNEETPGLRGSQRSGESRAEEIPELGRSQSSGDPRAEEIPEFGRFQSRGDPRVWEVPEFGRSQSLGGSRAEEIPEFGNSRAEMFKRTVRIQFTNETKDITLKNPRTYFYNGHSSVPPSPKVPPGSSSSECFFTSPSLKGCVGVLVYEAEPFTLAVYFCNPLDYNVFPMELGLELSLDKIHLDTLDGVYARLSARSLPVPTPRLVADRIELNRCQGPARVSLGPVRVTATMSNDRQSTVRVLLEEREGGTSE